MNAVIGLVNDDKKKKKPLHQFNHFKIFISKNNLLKSV